MIYKCPVCGKEFRRRVILNLHRSSHAKFKYKCQICGKVFSLRYQVIQHQRLHGLVKLGQCKTYPEVYKHLSGLMKNSRADFSDWPFKCRKCPSSFLKSSYLSAHLFRVHATVTNAKPAALKRTNFRMVDYRKKAWEAEYQKLVPVGNEGCSDQNTSTLGLSPHVQQQELNDKSFVQQHGLRDKTSVQQHGLRDKTSVQQQGLRDKTSVQQQGLRDKTSVQQHGLRDKTSVQQHGLRDKTSVKQRRLRDKSCVQKNGLGDKSSVQKYGINHGLTHKTTTLQKSPLSRTLLESPRKSPGQLAKQRLMKKYQRFQSTYPASRRLCLDKNPYASRSLHGKSTGKYEELRMPRLREIKVVLKDVRFNGNNGLKVLNIEPNRTTLSQKTDASVSRNGDEENLSDTSEEDSMPHLHRVSSEEKACESDDSQSDAGNKSDKGAVSVKTEGFKEREGLFEVLQQEHVNSGVRKSIDYRVSHKECSNNNHRTPSDKTGLNGIMPLKSRRQSSTKSSKDKVNNANHRTGIFSMPDLMMVSEWSRVDTGESMEKRSMPKLQGTNYLSTFSGSNGKERTIPKLTLKKIAKPFVSDSSQGKHKDSCISRQSKKNNNTDNKVTAADFLHSTFSKTPSTLCNLRRIHHCDSKCAPPCCESPDSPHLPASGVSKLNDHTASRTKRHHRDASSLMTDLSELKHDREDQAEVYPDSLSSVEDLWEGSAQTRARLSSSFLLERRMSCPSTVTCENVPVKRRRHMTISGKEEDPRKPCRVARERRRRQKPLSHRCVCCMDQGSGRKRKKRKYRRREKTFDWEITEVLSAEQADFIHNLTLLLSLRHKVYRLCQVLFPKLASVWRLNPDTEQVDMLVTEIMDVTRTVSSKREMDSSADGRMCHTSDGITLKSDDSEESLDMPVSTLCNVGELSCDIPRQNNLASSGETSDNMFSNSRLNSPVMSFPLLWKEENGVSDRCKQVGKPDAILGHGRFGDNQQDWTESHNDEPLIPNLKCCDITKGDSKDLVSPASDGDVEYGLPLLECYASSQLDSYEGSAPDPGSTFTDNIDDAWGVNVLETIQEESLTASVSQLNHDSTPVSLNTQPASDPVRGSECSLWGSTANKSWESEFMKYLKGHSMTPAGKPEGSAKSNVDRIGNPDTSGQTLSSETLDIHMSDIQVSLCKNPYLCLTRLRRKVILLLQPLLPHLTFENNFDKFSDDVDMLVELVTQSNETKEATNSVVD